MKQAESTDTKICCLIRRTNLKTTAFQKIERIFWLLFICLNLSGAIEAAVIYVPGDYSTIQVAIDASVAGDEVIVSPGTYHENINFNGKNIILRSTDPTNPSVVASTIIDGSSSGTVVTFSGSELPDCVLKGFTITNGYAPSGGGIRGQLTTHAIIEYNIITSNTAYGSLPFGFGGGLYGCYGTIQNNIISYSAANESGGGLFNCDGTIQNNIVYGNSAGERGGGFFWCIGTIQNNTIYGNSAGSAGGGLSECWFPGTIQNCVIWQNTAPSAAQVYSCDSLNYNCIQDWPFTGGGNISDNPQLVDPANGDFHLQSNSPCIDAGCIVNLSQDFEGDPRPFDGTSEPRGDGSDFDIGADEYYPYPAAVSPKIWSLYR